MEVRLDDRIEDILAAGPVSREDGDVIGTSREGRPIRAFRIGTGPRRISMLAGCHADEPVGPRFLRHLTAHLGALSGQDTLVSDYEWWLVPHINPDGEERNRVWHRGDDLTYDLPTYLAHVVREPPGDDIEFGFPRADDDDEARPENRAVYSWWRGAGGAFALHASLHGMAFAAGPWFLVEAAWRDRMELLRSRCTRRVRQLGYSLHDVERHGEKGFVRLGRGFCTRPDSENMRRHFLALNDTATAALFRPSSMETIRSLGGDPLTLVSEMPLFLTPGVGETLGPPDPVAERWKTRIAGWRAAAADPDRKDAVEREATEAGLTVMPVRDQMTLQWTLITAGLAQVHANES